MKELLSSLSNHYILTKEEAKDVMLKVGEGTFNPSQLAVLISVYMMRTIRVEELLGFREALLELCIPVDFSAYNTIDLCGTGGDGKNTFNISTLASFIGACIRDMFLIKSIWLVSRSKQLKHNLENIPINDYLILNIFSHITNM